MLDSMEARAIGIIEPPLDFIEWIINKSEPIK
jgi:hypothetical protein